MGKRGQAGIEYVVLVGVLLVFLIPIVHYALTQSSTTIKINQLDNAVRRLTKAADAVYALGPGAQDVVTITLPHGIESAGVGNYSIGFQVGIFGAISDFSYGTTANVTGTLPVKPGTYRILISHTNVDVVEVKLKPA